jgi:hypothetical protein
MTYDALITRYLGPTDSRGSRIRATLGEFRTSVPYDYAARDTLDAHRVAVDVLLDRVAARTGDRLRVTGIGSLPTGYVFTVEADPDR